MVTPTYRDDPAGNMADLKERMVRAAGSLAVEVVRVAATGDVESATRLNAKRSGVLLALDYLRSYEEGS